MLIVGINCQAQSDSTSKKMTEAIVKITHTQISILSDSTFVTLDIKVFDQKGTDTFYRCSSQDGLSTSISIIRTSSRPMCIVTQNDFSKVYVIKNKFE